MSQILDKLKKAEQERARVIAERGGQAAGTELAREEYLREQRRLQAAAERSAAPTREQRSRFAAGLGVAVAMAIVFWVGTLMPRKAAPPEPAPAAPARAAPAAPVKAPPPALFRLDADVDAFAARLKAQP